VCCASAGADRPECGICADPAYVVIPPAIKSATAVPLTNNEGRGAGAIAQRLPRRGRLVPLCVTRIPTSQIHSPLVVAIPCAGTAVHLLLAT
jgi:hypothetical protein